MTPSPNRINALYPGFLFIGGYIATSSVFSDINDKFKSSLWFSLPGSSFEKYVLGFLISGVGYVVFITGAFFLASIISAAITQPLFGFSMTIFNPFYSTFFYLIVIYLMTQPMFLVGSIVFKKAAFIKTLLTAAAVHFGLVMVVSLVGFVVFKLGMYDCWDQQLFLKFDIFTNESGFFHLMKQWGIGFGIAFNIFFNVVGYLKLTEKEVKGGI